MSPVFFSTMARAVPCSWAHTLNLNGHSGSEQQHICLVISPNVLINTFVEVAVWPAKLFQETLVTQRLARNTSVALSVAMLATKSLITFCTRCHSIAGAVLDEWLLLCRLRGAVAQEAQPVCQCPGISLKQKKKKRALSSVSVPAPTQKRRMSQAQEQVIQVPQSPDS